MIIMHTRLGQVVYVPDGKGGYNVFSLPTCRAIFNCTLSEAQEAVKHFMQNGTAIRVEYIKK